MTDKKNKRETISTAAERCRNFLLSTINKDGWWPYKQGGGPSLEATSWCLVPLMTEKEISKLCASFLAKAANEDGGWPTAPGTGPSCWVGGPVMLALRRSIQTHSDLAQDRAIKQAVAKGLLFLTDNRTEFYTPAGRLVLLIGSVVAGKGSSALDYARGWPWDPHCFHWVEPTSYNLLALKLPGLPNISYIQDVIKFANQFLIEHSCTNGGGWNHGCALSLGAHLPPFRVTTAEALLALQDMKRHAVIAPALTYLKLQRDDDSSTMSLAWSILALHAFNEDFSKELAFLLNRQNDKGSFSDNFMVNGLTLSALQAAQGKSPFKLEEKKNASTT